MYSEIIVKLMSEASWEKISLMLLIPFVITNLGYVHSSQEEINC